MDLDILAAKYFLVLKKNFFLLSPILLVLLVSCGSTAPSGKTSAVSEIRVRSLTHDEQMRFDALFFEAIQQKMAENYDAEYELLDAALKVNPDAPEALLEMASLKLALAETYVDSLTFAEGDSLLRRAVALNPEDLDSKAALAEQLMRTDDGCQEAVKLYEEIAEKEPTMERLVALLASQEGIMDYEGGIRTIERLEALEGKSENFSKKKFELYLMMGDTEHAYAAIEELCAEYPADLSYRVLLGDLHYQRGYKEMALAIYKDVLTHEPNNAYGQISLLSFYKAEGQDSLAQALVEDIVLNPNAQGEAKTEAMRLYVVNALMNSEDSTKVLKLFEDALELPQDDRGLASLCAEYMQTIGLPASRLKPVMKKILEVEPDFKSARFQLLNILVQEQDMPQIAELCREGHLYEPEEVVYYFYEAIALQSLDDDAGALKALEVGATYLEGGSDPASAAEFLTFLGDVYYDMERKEEAFEVYDAALEYNPDNILCLNNYAYFLSLEEKNLEKAEMMSRRTVEAEPENSTYLDTYAWILYKEKKYTQARIYIDQALKFLDEEVSANILDHAGDIYFRCGESTEAVKFWVKALGQTKDKKEQALLRKKIRYRKIL